MVKIILLGTAQDGGIPHPNCLCKVCVQAINDPHYRRLVASLAIVGEEKTLMIDATPDIIWQSAHMKRLYPDKMMGLDGILITHLHMGHYAGLLQLGKEAASTENFPVYTTPENINFLQSNKPFSYLEQRGEISFNTIISGKIFSIDPTFSIRIFEVPHRNEDGNTIGVEVISTTSKKNLIYIPDIDYLDPTTIKLMQRASLVIFDGTFYEKNDIMRQNNVPHPPVLEVMSIYKKPENQKFYFTHFNHTNPALFSDKIKNKVASMNFHIACDFDCIDLG